MFELSGPASVTPRCKARRSAAPFVGAARFATKPATREFRGRPPGGANRRARGEGRMRVGGVGRGGPQQSWSSNPEVQTGCLLVGAGIHLGGWGV